MNRKREQVELIYKLGQLLGPIEQVSDNPTRYDHDEQERIRARFQADLPRFYNQCVAFFNGEPDHVYGRQIEIVAGCYTDLLHKAAHLQRPEELKSPIEVNRQRVIDAVLSVPIPTDSAIYEAQTPFTTYCFVKDLCSTVKTKIVWLDRYFDQTIFHRFFTDTPKSATVTLVTLPASKASGAKDRQRVAEFMDISRLFAAERGAQGYRLVEHDDFHDRWLQCDGKLFTLGGSIKDLDSKFTIARLDSSPANQKHFDDVVQQGVEVFGLNHPQHP